MKDEEFIDTNLWGYAANVSREEYGFGRKALKIIANERAKREAEEKRLAETKRLQQHYLEEENAKRQKVMDITHQVSELPTNFGGQLESEHILIKVEHPARESSHGDTASKIYIIEQTMDLNAKSSDSTAPGGSVDNWWEYAREIMKKQMDGITEYAPKTTSTTAPFSGPTSRRMLPLHPSGSAGHTASISAGTGGLSIPPQPTAAVVDAVSGSTGDNPPLDATVDATGAADAANDEPTVADLFAGQGGTSASTRKTNPRRRIH